MTYEEIENRRNEIEKEIAKVGYTDELEAEWKNLLDEEMNLEMKKFAVAVARTSKVTIFVRSIYEFGYALNIKANGEWEFSDGYTACEAMKKFADLARKHNVKMCLVRPEWLDINYLKELDDEDRKWREQEAYADACMASAYGNDSLMERWEREHGIEKEYSPSNPWDAPGMKVSDFI